MTFSPLAIQQHVNAYPVERIFLSLFFISLLRKFLRPFLEKQTTTGFDREFPPAFTSITVIPRRGVTLVLADVLVKVARYSTDANGGGGGQNTRCVRPVSRSPFPTFPPASVMLGPTDACLVGLACVHVPRALVSHVHGAYTVGYTVAESRKETARQAAS